jgi:hypothetical protein
VMKIGFYDTSMRGQLEHWGETQLVFNLSKNGVSEQEIERRVARYREEKQRAREALSARAKEGYKPCRW